MPPSAAPRKSPTPEPTLAREIMTREVVSVPADLPVAEAADILFRKHVSNAPVVEHDMVRDVLVGFISEKDVLQCYASGALYAQPKLAVSEIMRPNPVSVRPETDLYTLAAIFMQHGYRHVPVTVSQVLQGMVSRRDVMGALMDGFYQWQRQDPAQRKAPDLRPVFTPKYLLG